MASKRVLYKPVQTNVGKTRNRRPLTQGRLVTAPAHPSSSAPRLKQGVVNQKEGQGMAVTSQAIRDDPQTTPRRAVPRVSHQHSPVATPPIHTLDLSDSEDDNLDAQPPTLRSGTPSRHAAVQSSGRQVVVETVPQVMVLDASLVSASPHHADVECVVGYERSPATVICHTHSPREEAVWAVREDQVPKAKNSSPHLSQPAAISPLSDAAAHHHHSGDVDPDGGGAPPPQEDEVSTLVSRSSAQRRKVESVRQKHPVPRLAQPSFEDSEEVERGDTAGGRQRAAVSAPSEVTSDSDACSLFEYVPQARSRPKTAEEGSKAVPPKSAKKKKGGRTVPSRYMQSATSKKGNSSTSLPLDKTLPAKKSLICTSSMNTNNSGTQMPRKKAASNSRTAAPHHLSGGSSPDQGQSQSAPQGKTSTPTHDGVPIMASCDASAIHPELSMLSAIDASQLRLGAGSGPSGSHRSPRKQKKVDLRAQQQRLDLSYARCLQWLFLASKAELCLQQQEKDAMRQLHALWALLEKTRQEKAHLEQDMARLRHLNMLDQQLDTQHQALEPVVRVLPTLQKDFGGLASAVDTTRHQITVRGIHLPDDQDFYLASLEQVLMESEQLLGTLSTLTRKQAPAVSDFSDACQAVQQAVHDECLELNRCGELLSAVQSLTTHENSLRIQAMQSIR
ncbi:uncharacterized protein LOC143279093 isoform X2 [Babylonia areolata]|uniref:uncharacterized protein LOC143279093 isoform X2 n=1 Tax=Babylonia areolata TaxID=304850 RepID=UPI003FD68599